MRDNDKILINIFLFIKEFIIINAYNTFEELRIIQ